MTDDIMLHEQCTTMSLNKVTVNQEYVRLAPDLKKMSASVPVQQLAVIV